MAIGFVLIRAVPGKERDVYERLLKLQTITELYPLFGEYDFLAKLTAEDFQALGEFIVDEVRAIPNILETKTFTTVSL